MTSRWVRTWTGVGRDQGEWAEDLDGRRWADYAQRMTWLDRLAHYRHRPQSRYLLGGGSRMIERCRCGKARLDGQGQWKTTVEG
jgi:hypothetical protein